MIIVFNSLTEDNIREITLKNLQNLSEIYSKKGYNISFSHRVVDYLAKKVLTGIWSEKCFKSYSGEC